MKKAIGLIHNQPIPEGQANWESSADVIAQVEAIETALVDLGHTAVRIPFTRDLGRLVRQIEEAGISMAFNLCESVDDNPQFAAHPAAVLELMNIPFTGSPAAALMITTDKHLVKLVLQAAGLNTPRSCLYSGEEPAHYAHMRFPVILKPQFQDASIGIDQESVITDPGRVPAALRKFYGLYGPIVVEEYIDGREFNISLMGAAHPEVMPAAEIDFTGFPDDLFKIVGYRAKWEPESIEYRQTQRTFPALPADMAEDMASVATQCYQLFGLRDYGRVDLRLDANNKAYILEINANPCLSPDAGFPAAVQQSGLDYTAMVEKIVSFVSTRST
ncbi:D-alanine--D-alanine ligase [Desulfopila sp. IMCC35006]|uniref:D-alanine--D-alanine ligase family protein n=1 Tax=Desulfopila sp. IMCC35006 TaxID=2569542 RepID=UPI0010AB53B6|nr:D-alanine--D-alanine ligase [Desulfopila sp. IMCC35006]TKB26957.1 D-alanine--D-alanine ligase [Desulfopila sp. IMCC35006]